MNKNFNHTDFEWILLNRDYATLTPEENGILGEHVSSEKEFLALKATLTQVTEIETPSLEPSPKVKENLMSLFQEDKKSVAWIQNLAQLFNSPVLRSPAFRMAMIVLITVGVGTVTLKLLKPTTLQTQEMAMETSTSKKVERKEEATSEYESEEAPTNQSADYRSEPEPIIDEEKIITMSETESSVGLSSTQNERLSLEKAASSTSRNIQADLNNTVSMNGLDDINFDEDDSEEAMYFNVTPTSATETGGNEGTYSWSTPTEANKEYSENTPNTPLQDSVNLYLAINDLEGQSRAFKQEYKSEGSFDKTTSTKGLSDNENASGDVINNKDDKGTTLSENLSNDTDLLNVLFTAL